VNFFEALFKYNKSLKDQQILLDSKFSMMHQCVEVSKLNDAENLKHGECKVSAILSLIDFKF